MRRLNVPMMLIPVALLMAGCGSSSSGHYTDPSYKFKIKVPSGWQAPKSGKPDLSGMYAVQFVKPSGLRISVTTPFKIGTFANGVMVHNPNSKVCVQGGGAAAYCRYWHVTVHGLVGEEVIYATTATATDVFRLDYFLVSSNHTYAIQLLQDHISASEAKSLHRLVESFRVGPQG